MANLIQALTHARTNTAAAEDWLILRFDRNDATLECYWSEPNAPYYLTSSSGNSSGATRGWGGHAEMNMIRDFALVLNTYTLSISGNPQLVELFLSRSPCSRSPQFNVGAVVYPVGCGNKLVTHARLYPNMQFEVIYDEVFHGNRANPTFDAGAHNMIALINSEGNMVARRFNMFSDQ